MSRVLVTGAAGFIGYHVADRLAARGDRVIGIDDFNAYYDPRLKRARVADLAARHGDRVTMLPVDFADDRALDAALAGQAFDRIVHLGAQPGVRYSIDHPMAYARANLVGHLAMLELGRQRGVRHLVYASSSSVYGGNTSLPFRVGDAVDHPVSLYAATKKADELMTESYAHLYRLPATGLRFFTVYGPWGRPDMAVWLFTQAILAGRPIRVFNDGRMQRDFTYIDDIVAGVVAALDRPPADDGVAKPGGSIAPHALYNLGNHRAEPLSRLIDLVEAACGVPAIRDLQPMQPGDVPATYADITDAARDLDFAPATGIDVGVPKFVRWYRDYAGV
ncbi:UDP-glucuronate 4-epimerase [Sphingomonas sp. SORGH_AS802]|uniref:NAD-dependent epimerase/dehydratase family protein n=1 Tax=unclassified Sphingomonas TaxID=196159 RepID=UPI00285E754A|nr:MULTISPECIES: NAD-dependent epimerase/dehydratase family protein [unclassified Sphingomonas]MDR6127989.1 UDP-glucuronate 4-epimerase [Sphingomonas sp. SORGH_AS_0438]MDR6133101.1 UDP-glucuronate 4-epimerase [Sphingomonas sp. SORGH_AS_0802]